MVEFYKLVHVYLEIWRFSEIENVFGGGKRFAGAVVKMFRNREGSSFGGG